MSAWAVFQCPVCSSNVEAELDKEHPAYLPGEFNVTCPECGADVTVDVTVEAK